MQIEVEGNNIFDDFNRKNVNRDNLNRGNTWSIHTSRCIIVLSILLEDYTTAYVCCC